MPPDVSRRRAVAAVVVLSFAAFAFVTTELLPIGLLTLIAPDLERSRSEIGLLVTGYAAVVFLASVPLTALTQRIPRRRLLGATMVVFTGATAASALAGSYWQLAGARLLTALTQALFWSVVASTTTGLFPVGVRGRIVARFSVGPALAPVVGVPAATWLGQQAGWRTAFAVTAGAALLVAVAVVALLPSYPPGAGGAARGTAPDRRRYVRLLVVTSIGVGGFLTFQTYVTPFLLDVSGFAPAALAPLLFVAGAAGVIGTAAVGRFLDARPVGALRVPLGLLTVALLGLAAIGMVQPAAVVLLAIGGIGYSAFAAAVQARILQIAPGSTDLASAGASSAFNLGIAAGSAIGGALLPGYGPRGPALVGGMLTAVALAVMLADRRPPAVRPPTVRPPAVRPPAVRPPAQRGGSMAGWDGDETTTAAR
jgi:predicted MFS family arabinose efflux permease